MSSPSSYDVLMFWLTVGGIAALVVGVVLLTGAIRKSWLRRLLENAPITTIASAHRGEPIWLRGEAACGETTLSPHFEIECLAYYYRLDENYIALPPDEDGDPMPVDSWRNLKKASRGVPFQLREGDQAIAIDGARAVFEELDKKVERDGNHRHTLEHLPFPTPVSAFGKLGQDGLSLHPAARDLPVVVTGKGPRDVTFSVAKSEKRLWISGSVVLVAGLTAIFCRLLAA